MRKFTLILGLVGMAFMAMAQPETDKHFTQSFSTEGIETIIIKIDGEIEFKTWNHPRVSVQTSLIPINAKYRALEVLAKTGDFDVLTAGGGGKMLIYDNPNTEDIYFKGERQTMDISYTIHVPEGMRVIDVYRNDLLAISSR